MRSTEVSADVLRIAMRSVLRSEADRRRTVGGLTCLVAQSHGVPGRHVEPVFHPRPGLDNRTQRRPGFGAVLVPDAARNFDQSLVGVFRRRVRVEDDVVDDWRVVVACGDPRQLDIVRRARRYSEVTRWLGTTCAKR